MWEPATIIMPIGSKLEDFNHNLSFKATKALQVLKNRQHKLNKQKNRTNLKKDTNEQIEKMMK
jgi:hypothetical protein